MPTVLLILIVASLVVAWPLAGWLLSSIGAPRDAWACPRCSYDVRGTDDDAPCPECGLTRELAMTCLPLRPRRDLRWWSFVPMLSVAAILAFGFGSLFVGPQMVVCMLPVLAFAYVAVVWSMLLRFKGPDRRILMACLGSGLVAAFIGAVLWQSIVIDAMWVHDFFQIGFVGAILSIPAGGYTVLVAAVIIRRRWHVVTRRVLAAARDASNSAAGA